MHYSNLSTPLIGKLDGGTQSYNLVVKIILVFTNVRKCSFTKVILPAYPMKLQLIYSLVIAKAFGVAPIC